MTGLVLLDVSISVLFVILILSIVASAITESIAGMLGWRSQGLKLGVARLLGGAFETFWHQPLIESLRGPKFQWRDLLFWEDLDVAKFRAAKEKRDPSYLPPQHFAQEVLVFLGLDQRTPQQVAEALRERMAARQEGKPFELPPHAPPAAGLIVEQLGDIEARLFRVLVNVTGEVEETEKAIAQWFDDSMQRVSGWYVRRTKLALFAIGLLMAAVMNVNLINYAQVLIEDDRLRADAVAAAEAAAAYENLDKYRASVGLVVPALDPEELADAAENMKETVATGVELIAERGVPMGWDAGFTLSGLLSWVLVGAAVTLGAQFWFDLLKMFVQVRSAGKKLVAPGRPAGSAADAKT